MRVLSAPTAAHVSWFGISGEELIDGPLAAARARVDTHKDVHVAVLLDRSAATWPRRPFGTTDAANRDLVTWTQR